MGQFWCNAILKRIKTQDPNIQRTDNMQVFKFGGASLKDAAGVKNVASILQRYQNESLIIVVSAMGKSTNALEAVVAAHAKQTGGSSNFV